MTATASDLYKAGQLREAIEAQVLEVKAKPADQGRRMFLFELLLFAGELDRAKRQIDAVTYDDPTLVAGVAEYRQLVESETLRRKVFSEGVAPGFLGAPTEHLALRLEAAGHLRLGHAAEAAGLLDQANSAMPPFGGTLNGQPFSHLRDADDLLAGVLEVMAGGRYFWIGLEQVVTLAANPPRYPRDLIYIPARLQMGPQSAEVYLPALYPGTHAQADDALRLGRMTDWTSPEGGPVLGTGARMFIADDEPVPLLEWRQYVQGATPAPAAEAERG
jgi:type VI secretion system protein ImpE